MGLKCLCVSFCHIDFQMPLPQDPIKTAWISHPWNSVDWLVKDWLVRQAGQGLAGQGAHILGPRCTQSRETSGDPA